MSRIRLDKLLVKRKIVLSEDQARELIENGLILVNGATQTSPASFVDNASAIEFVQEKSKYVSRGGFKLEKALELFQINPAEKRCLDIGASTGGFTDCLLQAGAMHVVSVDVGHGQIDLSLRSDPRVSVLEKTNARSITTENIGGFCELGVMDVSFTSVIGLIGPIVSCLNPVELIVLIKPQFECDQKDIDSRGIVNNPTAHIDCINKIISSLDKNLVLCELAVSPIKGTKGNIEYLALIKEQQAGVDAIDESRIEQVVNSAFALPEELND